MGKEKVLIFGADGLVGQSLTKIFSEQSELEIIPATRNGEDLFGIETLQVDLKKPDELTELINTQNPDYVINCAAISSISQCESDPKLAKKINTTAVEAIQTSLAKETKLIQFSSSAVFSNPDERLHSEDDIPNPKSIYGKTKLEAEKISIRHKNNLVVRLGLVIGGYLVEPKQRIQRLHELFLSELEQNNPLEVIEDAFLSPILLSDVVSILQTLIFKLESEITGVVHLTSGQRMSKAFLATQLATAYDYNINNIIPVKAEHFGAKHSDMSLDIPRLRKLGIKPKLITPETLKNAKLQSSF